MLMQMRVKLSVVLDSSCFVISMIVLYLLIYDVLNVTTMFTTRMMCFED